MKLNSIELLCKISLPKALYSNTLVNQFNISPTLSNILYKLLTGKLVRNLDDDSNIQQLKKKKNKKRTRLKK